MYTYISAECVKCDHARVIFFFPLLSTKLKNKVKQPQMDRVL